MTKEPPRKLSVEDLYKGTEEGAAVMKVTVSFNGVDQGHATAYDLDAGTLERIVTDEDGKPVLDPLGLELLRETVHGKVEVRWKENA